MNSSFGKSHNWVARAAVAFPCRSASASVHTCHTVPSALHINTVGASGCSLQAYPHSVHVDDQGIRRWGKLLKGNEGSQG